MIDTEKYKGHTEGPWELITNYNEEDWDNKWVGSVHLFTTLGISFDVVGVNETDVQLMADAPLLLAEVKQLQEEVEERITAHHTLANGWSRAEQEWEQEKRRLLKQIEQLKEMIE